MELIIGGIILLGVLTIISDLIVLCLWSAAIVAVVATGWYVWSNLALRVEAKKPKS